VSFAIGTVALTLLASLSHRRLGQISEIRTLPVLTMSVMVDQSGLLGVARDPTTAPKLAGLALLAAGTFLVVRG
jgi:uncharacterized membrane protein YdcZ (DUF606 family)